MFGFIRTWNEAQKAKKRGEVLIPGASRGRIYQKAEGPTTKQEVPSKGTPVVRISVTRADGSVEDHGLATVRNGD